MHPIAFSLGSNFDIHWYGVCMAVGFLCFLWTLRHFGRGTARTEDYISNLLTLLILSGIGGARAAYVIEHWSAEYAMDPMSILNIRQGGLMFYGGLLCAWIALLVFIRVKHEKPLDFLDFVVTALPLGHACGRIGCFFEGCCFGAITHGPLGVVYPMGSHVWSHQVAQGLIERTSEALPVYPSQLFESAGLILLYVLLYRHYWQRKHAGEQVAIYCLSYAILRFTIEMFRSDIRAHVGMFTISQFISLCLFLFGFGLLLYLHYRGTPAPKKPTAAEPR